MGAGALQAPWCWGRGWDSRVEDGERVARGKVGVERVVPLGEGEVLAAEQRAQVLQHEHRAVEVVELKVPLDHVPSPAWDDRGVLGRSGKGQQWWEGTGSDGAEKRGGGHSIPSATQMHWSMRPSSTPNRIMSFVANGMHKLS